MSAGIFSMPDFYIIGSPSLLKLRNLSPIIHPMDLYRFYVPNLPLQGPPEPFPLPETEAHHARSVLRLGVGDLIVAFDGRGTWCQAKIVQLGKREALVTPTTAPVIDPRPSPALTLATAIPKGDRADWLIEQASQLNVTAVQFLDCQRSVVKPREGVGGGNKLDKWQRLAMESAKQCGRTHLLEIREPTKLANISAPAAPPAHAARVLWLDPDPAGISVSAAVRDWHGDVLALIGPEGGWSDTEYRILEAAVASGWLRRVRLTSTVLRIETACAALAALVMAAR